MTLRVISSDKSASSSFHFLSLIISASRCRRLRFTRARSWRAQSKPLEAIEHSKLGFDAMLHALNVAQTVPPFPISRHMTPTVC